MIIEWIIKQGIIIKYILNENSTNQATFLASGLFPSKFTAMTYNGLVMVLFATPFIDH
jgi:hypothetical protein